MLRSLSFLLACALAALTPLLPSGEPPAPALGDFPGWPAELDGQPLVERPITAREQPFVERFPGRLARFTDGRREWVLRWVPEPTRRLHSAAQCYRAIGYDVEYLPLERDGAGVLWSVFRATKGEESCRVRERIHDDAGASWTDPSAWYWSVVTERRIGPWWAVTSVE